MKRRSGTTNRLIALAALLALAPFPAAAAKRDKALEAQLRAHIAVLASDEYEGREPGTEGEAKTLRYLAKQWFDIGLVSGTNLAGSPWFQPVTLVAREPAGSAAQFTRRGRKLVTGPGSVLMLTSGKRSLVENAPVLFVGAGAGELPGRSELAGRVALLLDGGAEGGERQNALLKAGASAVLTVLDGERSLESVSERRKRSGYALASETLGGDLEGFITAEGLQNLIGGAAALAELETQAKATGFAPRLLDFTATLEATTRETTIRTHNLIGRLPGRRPEAGAVLFTSHWDHFGTCASPPAEHLICNGAIDNASGVAALTEIARRLAKGPRPERDVYFVATTAEELGLLGAQAFAENPPLPLKSIAAAFNIDSVAIAPAGSAFGMVGKGLTPLDPGIAAVAKQLKRTLNPNPAPDTYLRRQDGWALQQHDIPSVLVSTAYGDIALLEKFFDSDYHRPSDVVRPTLELGGAADDVAMLVALGRWFGDPRRYPSPSK
ncbi:MAG: M20/M25/M40 family metallo-hydrolase [Novosphingobium sp.]